METFVIRLWVAAQDEAETAEALRGVLERVGSSDSTPFRGAEQLLELLRAGLSKNADDRASRTQGREGA